MTDSPATHNWKESIRLFAHPRVMTMLFFGVSAGLPLLLIFSSLSVWLREAGVERAAVTFFSWAALGYSFKFVWAPLVDLLPLPFLTKWFGRRRAWLLMSQLMVIFAISLMALVDPASDLLAIMALAAVFLGFSSATQDIVIDAYRIEAASSDLQAMMSSMYVAGYRIGMLIAGAGALFIADYFGTTAENYNYSAWQSTYLIMASTMLIGVVTTLLIAEPESQRKHNHVYAKKDYLRFLLLFVLGVLGFVSCFYFTADVSETLKYYLNSSSINSNVVGFSVEFVRLVVAVVVAVITARFFISLGLVDRDMVEQAYLDPVKDFFVRYGWSLAWLLLALIGLYRVSDIVLGVISNVFYLDLGFSKTQIGTVVKLFGVIMTLVGGFLGGLLTYRYGVMRILFVGAVLSALTNLLFMLLAQAGNDLTLFYVVVAADNLSAGLASAAFIAFLSSLTNISFTATQYAIFSSLMTLVPKVLGGYSGSMVDTMGYEQFFLLTALMGLPVLVLIAFAQKRFDLAQDKNA